MYTLKASSIYRDANYETEYLNLNQQSIAKIKRKNYGGNIRNISIFIVINLIIIKMGI